jgi:hypothetical protein
MQKSWRKMSETRDEEVLTHIITIRRYEVNSRLTNADGEILSSATSKFARPVNVDGMTNFIKKNVYRLADMVSEAMYIPDGGYNE